LGHQTKSALTAEAAFRLLARHHFDLVFFDHDLGDTLDGSAIAGQILYNPDDFHTPKAVWVHSSNPEGAKNIASKFRSADVPVMVEEFSTTIRRHDLGKKILELVPSQDQPNERVALLDMDSSLADFELSMTDKILQLMSPMELESLDIQNLTQQANEPGWFKARKTLIKRTPGFWLDLPVIPFGIELYDTLGTLGYSRMILTKGPRNNPGAWQEKVSWCARHVPDAGVTITHDKGLVYGTMLYDDFPPYITRWLKWRPRGRVLMLGSAHNEGFRHPNVLRVTRAPMSEQVEAILEFLGEL
jgi:5'-nucleotidase